MIFVYTTARVAGELKLRVTGRKLFLCAFAYGIIAILLYVGGFGSHNSYNAPHVWAFAVVVLSFFASYVSLGPLLSRFVIFLSPSMFGVYLLHETTSFGRLLYQIPQEWLNTKTVIPASIAVVASALFAFVLCTILDLGRRFFVRLVLMGRAKI